LSYCDFVGRACPANDFVGRAFPAKGFVGRAFPAMIFVGRAFPAMIFVGRACPAMIFVGRACPAKGFVGRACPANDFVGRACPANDFVGRACPANDFVGRACPANDFVGRAFPANDFVGRACPANDFVGRACPANSFGDLMCGIVGTVSSQPVNQDVFDALTALQHRGQDAAGIATCDDERLHCVKNNGLVREVIRTRHMYTLKGNMGMGHVRYPTAGSDSEQEAQPFYVNSPYGITLAHNGNLTNTASLTHELQTQDCRHLNTHSDSEILLNVFADALQKLHKPSIDAADIFQAVRTVHARCEGAYAVVAMIVGVGIVGFRDPAGIRPLVYGRRQNTHGGYDYMLASESVALDVLGYEVVGDVAPGEAIFISKSGNIQKQLCAQHTEYSPCLFEYVYLARPDSIIDKISVYKVRLRLGEHLAEKIKSQFDVNDIDVVMPIPDTSRTAAAVLARELGLKFREGFIKNRYIGRTFIMPGQQTRRKSVRQKLNTIPLEFGGKNVLLVDDSIVRGTTAKEIIQMARDAGAKKVFFASAAPQVRYPNVYGIDMPAAKDLIAHERSDDEVAKLLKADWLVFQDLSVLVEAAQEGNADIQRFEDSVFTGDYIVGGIDAAYLQRLEQARTS
jgi:amidophosphoribosyltransferase